MAKSGVWGLQQVRDKYLQSEWTYSGVQTLFAWGYNNYGQLADNNKVNKSSPIQIPGTWSTASSNTQNCGFINTSGELYTVGVNYNYGQLGLNNRTNYSSPIQIPGTTWSTIWTNYEWMAATKTDGTLWQWGWNEKGNLGLNNTTDYSSPVQVPGSTWPTSTVEGATGENTTGMIKTDGTLWTWGNNEVGGLGHNNTTDYSSPKQVPGTTWSQISMGNENTAAIKTDGTLWTWGSNEQGVLGQNALVSLHRSSPTQIPGTTWSKSTIGDRVCFALKTDGTLWAWGDNGDGSLGQNDVVKQSSPVQIPGTDWSDIAPIIGTGKIGMATKTDGTLWMWGDNGGGETGANNLTKYSSPIQVTGSPWTPLSVGGSSGEAATLAFRSV